MSQKYSQPLTHEEKEELNYLSKIYLGAASKWRKLEKRGKLISRVPGKKEPLIEDGRKISKYFRLSPQTLLSELRKLKAKEDAKKSHKERVRKIFEIVAAASGTLKNGN